MDLHLKNKTIMVAASSKGLGFGIAEAVAREGAQVSLASRSIEEIQNAAARIARKGRLQDAERMITGLPVDGPLGPATLDLKARICAQQGRLIEAQFCWIEAVRQSPGNETYRRSLDYVTRGLRPSRFSLVLNLVLMALCAVLVAIVIGTVGGRP